MCITAASLRSFVTDPHLFLDADLLDGFFELDRRAVDKSKDKLDQGLFIASEVLQVRFHQLGQADLTLHGVNADLGVDYLSDEGLQTLEVLLFVLALEHVHMLHESWEVQTDEVDAGVHAHLLKKTKF